MIIPEDKLMCEKIYKQWEKDTGMILELDIGSKIVQKDVNNYVFLKAGEYNRYDKAAAMKHIKGKGMYMRFWAEQLDKEDFYQLANFTINNTMTIVDEAIINYFIYGDKVEDTILKCKELIRFQKIVKLQSGFTNLSINQDDEIIDLVRIKNIHLKDPNDDNIYHGKSYRLFFVKNGYHLKRWKTLEDGTIKNDGIPDCSKNTLIWLDDVRGVNSDAIDLDYDWYIRFTKRKINAVLNKEIFPDNEL